MIENRGFLANFVPSNYNSYIKFMLTQDQLDLIEKKVAIILPASASEEMKAQVRTKLTNDALTANAPKVTTPQCNDEEGCLFCGS